MNSFLFYKSIPQLRLLVLSNEYKATQIRRITPTFSIHYFVYIVHDVYRLCVITLSWIRVHHGWQRNKLLKNINIDIMWQILNDVLHTHTGNTYVYAYTHTFYYKPYAAACCHIAVTYCYILTFCIIWWTCSVSFALPFFILLNVVASAISLNTSSEHPVCIKSFTRLITDTGSCHKHDI